jgi:hypothetical protein
VRGLSSSQVNRLASLTVSSFPLTDPDPEVKLLAIRCSYNAFYNLRPPKERRKERSEKR